MLYNKVEQLNLLKMRTLSERQIEKLLVTVTSINEITTGSAFSDVLGLPCENYVLEGTKLLYVNQSVKVLLNNVVRRARLLLEQQTEGVSDFGLLTIGLIDENGEHKDYVVGRNKSDYTLYQLILLILTNDRFIMINDFKTLKEVVKQNKNSIL